MDGEKSIKDPVHGYITIPREYCRLFVDTPIFQRLRLIEQTSMRWLFPGARHDRFIHSLGVYHLATRIYAALEENVKDGEISKILKDSSNLKSTFLVASLMHDCGHSPFSHTFEKFYNRNVDGTLHDGAFKALKKIVPAKDPADLDFTKIGVKQPAPHEAMSAFVLLTQFSDAMSDVGADPGLAARMITGASYKNPSNTKDKVANVLIELVNGSALDVDKLDYIIRDTWASGVKNTAIDVDRLVHGATIVRTQNQVGGYAINFAFKKSSISVVQSVIDARNYLYDWIYGHHTVLYYSHLLEQAVISFAKQYAKANKTTPKTVVRRMFSPEMFSKRVPLSKQGDFGVYLLSDGDIVHCLKMFAPDDPSYIAYSSHKPRHVSLWKTGAEYRRRINEEHQFAVNAERCISQIRRKFGLSPDECFACSDMTMKIYDLKDDAVKIEIADEEVMPITKVAHLPRHPHLTSGMMSSLFYVYLAESKQDLKTEIINYINKMPVRKVEYCKCRHAPKGRECSARKGVPCYMSH